MVNFYESKLFQYINNFVTKVMIYPESVMDFAKEPSGLSFYKYHYKNVKRQKAVADECEKLYPFHTMFSANFHSMKGTLILQGTPNSIKFLIEEAAIFTAQLEKFNKVIKTVNNIPELALYYKDTFMEKPNEVLPLLLDEIFSQSKKYGFEVDKVEIISTFKSIISETSNKFK